MLSEKEINDLAEKLIEKEQEIPPTLVKLSQELKEASNDKNKQTEIIFDKIIPINILSLILMSNVNVLSYVAKPKNKKAEELFENVLNSSSNAYSSIKQTLEMFKELFKSWNN